MPPANDKDLPSKDIEAALIRLREDLRLLDKLELSLAAAYVAQAIDSLEQHWLQEDLGCVR